MKNIINGLKQIKTRVDSGTITTVNGTETLLSKQLEYLLNEALTIPVVVGRSELLSFFDSFYNWHKKQGYISVKRDDFEEYLKTLNCG